VASDVNELQEIRARQRTFHGAYNRTALGTLGYAVVILRLFDSKFHRSKVDFLIFIALLKKCSYAPGLVGLLFAFMIAFLRSRHSTHDFADRGLDAHVHDTCIKTKGQENGRIFGRPFITAGWIVVEVTAVVAAAEVVLLVLILKY
jgi:uncharacterized membrane protein YidH (DUF202 family)